MSLRGLFKPQLFLGRPLVLISPSKGNKNGQYTANSRKVVRKNAFDNPEKYCAWF